MPPHKTVPPKADIAAMEPFDGLDITQVFVVTNLRQANQAVEELLATGTVGFDTESKPTFKKGCDSGGPHVFQFATLDKAFIFHTHVGESRPAIIELLRSAPLSKIGFDLRGDLKHIANTFDIQPASLVDLGKTFRKLGYRNTVGAKSAIAMLFNRRLLKSKSVTTSNWAAKQLTERQLLYAANDAYAAIRVFHALESGQPLTSTPLAANE